MSKIDTRYSIQGVRQSDGATLALTNERLKQRAIDAARAALENNADTFVAIEVIDTMALKTQKPCVFSRTRYE